MAVGDIARRATLTAPGSPTIYAVCATGVAWMLVMACLADFSDRPRRKGRSDLGFHVACTFATS